MSVVGPDAAADSSAHAPTGADTNAGDSEPDAQAPTDNNQLAQRAQMLEQLRATADQHALHSTSDRTRQLYASDWRHFVAWCELADLAAVPAEPETVRLYLADMSMQLTSDGKPKYQASTMERRMAAISWYHGTAGHPSPARGDRVRQVVNGIARERQHRARRMRPLLNSDIKVILASLDYRSWPAGVAATRDAFAILAGYVGAFRRSELAQRSCSDVTWDPHDGLHVLVTRSKTDQAGQGAKKALPYAQNASTCVVCAYVRWIRVMRAVDHARPAAMRELLDTPPWNERQHICKEPPPATQADMPLLRVIRRGGLLADHAVSGDALHAMVKRRAAYAGYQRDVGFHSLRAGFVTQVRRNGAETRAVRRQTWHRSDALVDVYDREWVPLTGNAVTQLGL